MRRCLSSVLLAAAIMLALPVHVSPVVLAAQASPPSTQAPAAQAPRAKRAPTGSRTAARILVGIEVTDAQGAPIPAVQVRATGALDREGRTDAAGILQFQNLRAGTYRLRFEREGFVTLEREVTLAASREEPLAVVLSSAPPAVVVAAPEPERHEPARPVGEPQTVQVAAFTESHFIGRGEPQKLSILGCTGFATTRLLQVRDPMENRVNADADETLYVVAGEATLRLSGIDRPLDAGTLAVIPRGTTHALSRRGRNPAIFVSVLSGPECR